MEKALAKITFVVSIQTMSTKIYTGKGDQGKTGLVNGKQVSKSSARIAAYGTIDELNSILGMVGAQLQNSMKLANLSSFALHSLSEIQLVQNQLFCIGSHLACDDQSFCQRLPPLGQGLCERLENQIDEWTAVLPELKDFILPGGCESSATLHLARTVCRRAERAVTQLIDEGEWVESLIPIYLNRLSDYLFVFARYTNQQMGFADLIWKK